MMEMPKVLLLPPLMLALLLFAAPIQDGETWRVDQLTRTGVQKTLIVERDGNQISANLTDDESRDLWAKMKVEDMKRGHFSIRAGGAGPPNSVRFAELIKDFERESFRAARALALELQNGEKARLYRSADVIYLTAPGQGVTFAARKVE